MVVSALTNLSVRNVFHLMIMKRFKSVCDHHVSYTKKGGKKELVLTATYLSGYHPGKKWCSDRSDPTHHLYAVHKATEEGRLELLRLFMSRYPCSIIVQVSLSL